MKLLIVIVNFNSADLAIDCLRSLTAQRADLLGEGDTGGVKVVITDNASTDDSVARIGNAIATNGWGQWVDPKPLPRNGGFAYGNNAAIAPALESGDKPTYILLLNPDTVVRPAAIQTLLDFMEKNPQVGIAGSRLEDPDGTPQRSAFRFHSIAGEFERGIRIGFVTRLLAARMIAPPVSDRAEACDWVAGAAMMVRTAVFEQVGMMDEKYFMYFEEVDFCRRAAAIDWSCWYVPQSRVVHLVGAVSQISDNRKHRRRRPPYWFESRRRYFVKNHGRFYATLADLAFLIGFACWRLRRFIQRKDDTDPPRLLLDSISHSVFFRGWAV